MTNSDSSPATLVRSFVADFGPLTADDIVRIYLHGYYTGSADSAEQAATGISAETLRALAADLRQRAEDELNIS